MPSLGIPLKLIAASVAIDVVYFGVCYFLRRNKPVTAKKKTEQLIFFSDLKGSCLIDVDHDYLNCPEVDCPVKHERMVTKLLRAATSTLDLCMYSLSHEALVLAIKELVDKRVKVRVVTDANRADRNERCISKLRSWGVFVEEKSCEPHKEVNFPVSELHMHHKFAIIDDATLICGSVNWTRNSFSSNWDHLLISSDTSLLKPFKEEFEYLFNGYENITVHGRRKKLQIEADNNLPLLKMLESPTHKVLFFRREGLSCRPHINHKKPCMGPYICSHIMFRSLLHVLESASLSLDLCLNQFTLEDYSSVVIDLHKRGVQVRYICDRQMAPGSGSQVQALINAGVDVRMKVTQGAMHNKWCVIDKRLVIFGSLNWTMQSFCGNYENVVVSSVSHVVSEFSNNFDYMWSHFSPASEIKWGNTVEDRLLHPLPVN